MTTGIPLVVIVGGGVGGTTMVNAPYTYTPIISERRFS
jgi:hypothetical protein